MRNVRFAVTKALDRSKFRLTILEFRWITFTMWLINTNLVDLSCVNQIGDWAEYLEITQNWKSCWKASSLEIEDNNWSVIFYFKCLTIFFHKYDFYIVYVIWKFIPKSFTYYMTMVYIWTLQHIEDFHWNRWKFI